jgi:hypothetical protein
MPLEYCPKEESLAATLTLKGLRATPAFIAVGSLAVTEVKPVVLTLVWVTVEFLQVPSRWV